MKQVKLNLFIKGICLLVFAVILSVCAIAQPDGAGSGGTTGGESAPIDGGVSLLVIGAIGYGARKVYAARKKVDNGEESLDASDK